MEDESGNPRNCIMEDESGNPRNCSKKPCPNDLNKFNSLFCRTKIQ